MTVIAPYVTAHQYTAPTTTPAAKNGQPLYIKLSIVSKTMTVIPIFGKTIMYSV